MEQYINKTTVTAKINDWIKDARRRYTLSKVQFSLSDRIESLENLLSFIDKLEVKESDETAAKAFARIIRANLTGIDKDVQYKFEQLYKEITGERMYQGYND